MDVEAPKPCLYLEGGDTIPDAEVGQIVTLKVKAKLVGVSLHEAEDHSSHSQRFEVIGVHKDGASDIKSKMQRISKGVTQ